MKLLDKFFKVFLANSLQIPIGLLGPEDRGLYVLMVTIATMAAALTSLSLPTGSLFFYKKNFLKFNQIALINIFNLLTFISILSIFSIFFNEYLFQVLNISKISNYYLVTIICLIFITVILTFLHTMFLGKGMAKEYSIIILTNVISYFLLVIIFSLEESLNSFSATLSLLI